MSFQPSRVQIGESSNLTCNGNHMASSDTLVLIRVLANGTRHTMAVNQSVDPYYRNSVHYDTQYNAYSSDNRSIVVTISGNIGDRNSYYDQIFLAHFWGAYAMTVALVVICRPS